jgi:preprotein translocase subunit SecA
MYTYMYIYIFRYLAMVQTDESWCKHLSRLDLLKEEMVLQSFTAEKVQKINMYIYIHMHVCKQIYMYHMYVHIYI